MRACDKESEGHMNTEDRSRLSNAAIADATDVTLDALESAGVSKRISLRATILLEELLLRYHEQFGEEKEFVFSVSRRFGTIRMRIEVEGTMLNALDVTTADDDLGDEYDFVTILMQDDLEPPTYSYRHGKNVLTISVRVNKTRPIWANPMLVAVLLAVLSFMGLSRAGLAAVIAEEVVTPIVDMLMGVLKAIAGPLLCVSLISGICALGDVTTLRGMGRHAIARIMAWVVIMFAVSVAVSMVFYHGAEGSAQTSFDPGELFELLLSSIPTNLFAPFVEGNALQIAVESVFIGVCLLALGDRSTLIRKLVIELNGLAFKMMYIFSEALPALVGLSIFKTLVTTDVSGLSSLGLMVAVNLIIVAVISAGSLLWTQLTLRVSPVVFLRKTAPALLICLATGSGTSAMGEFFRISSKKLGVSQKIVDFWVPLGHAIYAPSVIVPLVVGMFAVSSMEGVAFSPTRIAILFILVFQLSIATPKVPGGVAATFTILLGQLGLPLDSVGILMAANVFVCNPEIAFGDLVRFTEICCFAKSEHALDKDALRRAD